MTLTVVGDPRSDRLTLQPFIVDGGPPADALPTWTLPQQLLSLKSWLTIRISCMTFCFFNFCQCCLFSDRPRNPRCQVRSLWGRIWPSFLPHVPVGKRLVFLLLCFTGSFQLLGSLLQWEQWYISRHVWVSTNFSSGVCNTSELLPKKNKQASIVNWFWQICAVTFDVCRPPTLYGPLRLGSKLWRRNKDGGKIPDIQPTS